MPSGKQAKAEALDVAVRLYQDGVPVDDVRRMAMVGLKHLYEVLRERGIPMRQKRSKPMQRDAVDRAVKLYQDGVPVREVIGRAGQCQRPSLYNALRERGIPTRREIGQKTLDRAVKLYQEGVPVDEIRHMAKIQKKELYKGLRERGIPLRSNVGRRPNRQGRADENVRLVDVIITFKGR